MSVIHELSSAAPLPEFDLFGVPPTQTIVDRDIVTEHKPITTLEPASFIQFEIPTSTDEYLRFENMYLQMRVKAKCAPKTSTAAVEWQNIGTCNYLLQSMIKQIDVFIGDTQITSSPSTYPYRAYFETLLGYGENAKETHLTSALWFNDENEKTTDKVIAKTTKYTKDGKEIDLIGKLHLDMTFQGRLLLGGCKLIIRILLNDAKFFMMSKNGYSPEMEFIDASLWVHRAKVHPQVAEAHNMALQVATAKYPITHIKVKASTIQSGQLDYQLNNVHSGQLPRRIFLAFVKNTAYCGDYGQNPFYFEHFKISELSAHLNGLQFPPKAYRPEFDNNICIREFHAFYEALDMLDTDSTCNINRDNYALGNTIFGWNFAPDLSNGCGAIGHLNQINYGALRIQIRFKEALTAPITAIVFCEFDKILEIDSSRNATIDFI
jgi:hypothetical protein